MQIMVVRFPVIIRIVTSYWAIPENIHPPPPPPMDNTELGTRKFQDFQEGQLQFLQDSSGIPEPTDSKS